MSVRIRLARHGAKKKPYYRIVAADIESPRDGRFLEMLGTYNPLQDPAEVNLKSDRIKYWMDKGAKKGSIYHRPNGNIHRHSRPSL